MIYAAVAFALLLPGASLVAVSAYRERIAHARRSEPLGFIGVLLVGFSTAPLSAVTSWWIGISLPTAFGAVLGVIAELWPLPPAPVPAVGRQRQGAGEGRARR